MTVQEAIDARQDHGATHRRISALDRYRVHIDEQRLGTHRIELGLSHSGAIGAQLFGQGLHLWFVAYIVSDLMGLFNQDIVMAVLDRALFRGNPMLKIVARRKADLSEHAMLAKAVLAPALFIEQERG